MLSRTASSLYWIGRHIERADFTARLIDAASKFDLLPYSDGKSGLRSAFEASGATYLYKGDKENIRRKEMLDFLAYNIDNPSSIASCLRKARHDARAVRTALTREVFEQINEAYIQYKTIKKSTKSTEMSNFVYWVENVARVYDGALQRTMLRNENFWFVRLGAALERIDNTARLIDVKYHMLLPKEDYIGGPIDEAQWTSLLRSVSAETAYRWIYREGLKPWNVAELLIFRSELPRSLISCIEEANAMLGKISVKNGRTGPADRRARNMELKIKKQKIDEVFQIGLHEFITDIIIENNNLGNDVAEQFLF